MSNNEVENDTNSEVEDKDLGGRPRKKLDENEIFKLASIGCTMREVAYVLDVHPDTIKRNYKLVYETGIENSKLRLRRAMMQNAIERMNPAVQIFLAKQKTMLGMTDTGIQTDEENILPWSD